MNCPKTFFFIIMAFLCALVSAKEKKESVPAWVKDFDSVYSRPKYIASMADGATQEEAMAKALESIAGYFKSSVRSSTTADSFMAEEVSDGETSWYKRRTVAQNVSVESNVDLFGVAYEFYFHPKQKKYYCAAFIDTKVCAQLLTQRMGKIEKDFSGYYAIGHNKEKNDSLTALRYYAKSALFAKDYISLADYLALVSPETEIQKSLIDKMSSVDSKVSALAAISDISVSLSGEANSVVETAVRDLFGNEGCVIKKKGEKAKYNMSVNVEKNIALDGDVFIASPNLTVALSLGNETIFSYNKNFERSKSFKQSTLEKQIESKIIGELKNSLIEEFYKNL